MTVWKTLKQNEKYEVSNTGLVKNKNIGRILSGRPDTKGYQRISISVFGKYKDYKIHRLVAFYFLENDNQDEKTEVNHKEGDKSNNSASNLEWSTPSGNMLHAFENGLHSQQGERNTNLKLSDQDVLNLWEKGWSADQIEMYFGISNGYARRLAKKEVRLYLLQERATTIPTGSTLKRVEAESAQ